MKEILVVYYSRYGATESLAREVCNGIDAVAGVSARLRTVASVSNVAEATEADVPENGPPFANNQDLVDCAGMLVGSPTRFGNMAAAMKHFLDGSGSEWLSGALSGKPAGVFTSTSSLHGGQETTLLSMALPLLHHGMVLVGLPYTEPDLSTTTTGGTPYGASHVTFNRDNDTLSEEEKKLAYAHGKRVAEMALKLAD